ncbi:MAG: hypothetical protein Kow0069_22620 [Promethearchaeota archaeon]
MKASISLVVKNETVRLGGVLDAFVHLHVFKPLKARKFVVSLICEEVQLQSTAHYLKTPAILFLYQDQEAFNELLPARIVRFEEEKELEGQVEFAPGDQRDYELQFAIPGDAPPTSAEREVYHHWFLKATLDKPHSLDVNQFQPVNVLPRE